MLKEFAHIQVILVTRLSTGLIIGSSCSVRTKNTRARVYLHASLGLTRGRLLLSPRLLQLLVYLTEQEREDEPSILKYVLPCLNSLTLVR